MKINCTCGFTIVDNTDYLRYKGHLISNTQWYDFFESIDHAVEKSGPTPKEKENALMQIRQEQPSKLVWECQNCGKLFFNSKKGDLITFSPDNKKYNKVLDKKI
ncbi:MAG: hypothetical protein ACI8ZM_001379 [Crocinitomix sp.]|jgi:hypothetical protein